MVDWFYENNNRLTLSQESCIKNYSFYRWIAFLDMDEYIVLLEQKTNIKDYLVEYEEFDGICLNWLVFGANNHLDKQKSTIYSYTQSCPTHTWNEHVKSIINPSNYLNHVNSHYMTTSNGSVNVFKEKVCGPRVKPYIIFDKMRINHYYCRSREDFFEKVARGGSNYPSQKYLDEHFNTLQTENVFNDDIIKLYDKIKKQC